MERVMELSRETLETIGDYVRGNLGSWMREVQTDREFALHERAIRVEEELKAQREIIQQGFHFMEKRLEQIDQRFELVEKRFEQVDKRFEQVDKRIDELRSDMNARFEDLQSHSNRWFTVISVVLGVFILVVTVSSFLG